MTINQRNVKKVSPSQKGFTLVELSIVLVIIGLIIGGVMTGQQIIQTARISSAANALQAFQAQIQTYSQNYGVLPGDDKSADTRFGLEKGNGNGSIGSSSSFDSSAAQDEAKESLLAWGHLRAAGLIKNQQVGNDTSVLPQNPFGGVYGIQNTAFKGALSSTVICMNNVPASAAQAIDTKLDDGLSDKGTLRSALGNGTGHGNDDVSNSYADGTYTLCIKM